MQPACRLALLVALVLALPMPAVAQGAKPDLTVQAIAFEPPSPTAGDVVHVRAQVHNEGTAWASNATVQLQRGTSTLGNVTVTLGPGASREVTFPLWTSLQGTQAFRVTADPGGRINESDEGNNALSRSLTVGAHRDKPELALEGSAFQPKDPEDGGTLTLFLYIHNSGEATAPAQRIHFEMDGVSFGDRNIQSLAVGASQQVPFTFVYEDFQKKLEVTLDADDTAKEHNEFDNEITLSMPGAGSSSGTAKPDLVLTAMRTPNGVRANQGTLVQVDVKNSGNAAAAASTLALKWNGQPVSSTATPSLASGATTTVDLTVTLTSNAGTMEATADSTNAVSESREDNNRRTLNVGATATPPPPPPPPPAPRAPDEAGIVDVAVENGPGGRAVFLAYLLGSGRYASGVPVVWEVDGVPFERATLVPAGATTPVRSTPWHGPSGEHTLVVRVETSPPDGNTANDMRSTTFTFDATGVVGGDNGTQPTGVEPVVPPVATGPLDVAVLSVGPAQGAPGAEVPITVRVENRGSSHAPPFTVDVSVDGAPWSVVTVSGLAPGASSTVSTRPWPSTTGTHTFRAVADAANRLAETDETNNEANATTTLGNGNEGPTVPPPSAPGNPVPGPAEVLFLAAVAAAALLRRRP